MAVNSVNSETLQNAWQCAKEILTTEELNKLVLIQIISDREPCTWQQIRTVQRHYKMNGSVLNKY